MVFSRKMRVGIVCLVLLGLFALPKRYVSTLLYPFIIVQSNVIDPIKRHHTHTKTEYEQLHSAYDQLMQKYLQVQAMHDYVVDTQEILSFNKRYDDQERVIAQVIERYFGDNEHYFLLDKGTADNIKADMIVVYHDMLVGKVIEVFPWYSKCMLITDKQCKVAGYCASTKSCGVMKGNNAKQLNLLHVSHLCEVELDDIVISSGHGIIFPRGFGLGKILDVHKNDMTYEITCAPLADLWSISHCSIVV